MDVGLNEDLIVQEIIEIPVRDKKQAARKLILERTIDEDRDAILDRWAKTFIHVGSEEHHEHQCAATMMMIAMAAVAKGDFQVSASGKNEDFEDPSPALCIADYLSHASRVMIDLRALSDKNRKRFLKYFNKETKILGTDKKVLDGRPSTHCIERQGDILIETKSKLQGAKGTVQNFVDAFGNATKISPVAAVFGMEGPPLQDFGVNLMMGGVGQINLSGGRSELGKDGHILIHFADQDAIMIGLEQTKPIGTNQDIQDGIKKSFVAVADYAKQKLYGTRDEASSSPIRTPSPESVDDDNSYGLSGKHSWLGNSDDYTAAGSLYFSNLIYKIKLMHDKKVLPPAKYNGMRVRLNNNNFTEFAAYFRSFYNASKGEDAFENIKVLLNQLPRTARQHLDDKQVDENYLSLINGIEQADLDAYFGQLVAVYQIEDTKVLDKDKDLLKQKIREIKAWLAQPRQLISKGGVLKQFVDEDIQCCSSHVHRFVDIINQCIYILEKNAVAELNTKLASPSENIRQMQLLTRAYKFIEPNEHAPVYELFVTQRDMYYSFCKRVRERLDDNYGLSFSYLMELDAIELRIAEIIITNESRALIALMDSNHRFERSIVELKENLEVERAQNRGLVTKNLEIETQFREYRERISIFGAEMDPSVLKSKSDSGECESDSLRLAKLIAEVKECAALEIKNEFREYRERIAMFEAEMDSSVLNSKSDGTECERGLSRRAEQIAEVKKSEEDVQLTIETPSVSNWDWAFVYQCLCSSTAVNSYGALLMIASALLLAATLVGTIPVVFGVTAVASAVVAGGACFFSARQNHSIVGTGANETQSMILSM